MKLLTFEKDGTEHWGFLVEHAFDGADWVFGPEQTERAIRRYALLGTSSYFYSIRSSLDRVQWPRTLAGFLKMEEAGMRSLHKMENFVRRFIGRGDDYILSRAGWPVAEVSMKAPIPRPRLLWGLVQNSPTFIRRDPERIIANLFPQGHDRPQGSVVGEGQTVVIPRDAGAWGFNCELGVVIGRKGRAIRIEDAMDYVAGYTVVTDVCHSGYFDRIAGNAGEGAAWQLPNGKNDWFSEATASWAGKKTDTCCPMGPYLVTRDAISNPYDLLVYTRASGRLRDRSHTGATMLGIERVIAWYSSFAALMPGDVIHFATMGVDGLPMGGVEMGPADYIESEIEKIGVLRNPVVTLYGRDWRGESDPSRRCSSPAARDVIRNEPEKLEANGFDLQKTRHFWTLFGNFRTVAEKGLAMEPQRYPRFLNGPASSLAPSGRTIRLSPRSTVFTICMELAFGVGKLARGVSLEDAEDYILGYMPLVSFCDHSFREIVREPATPQEKYLPAVYGRWGDGYNICGGPVRMETFEAHPLSMRLTIEGIGCIAGSTDEYTVAPAEALAFISRDITLFPCDVVTLGRVGGAFTLPKQQLYGKKGTLTIESLGEVSFVVEER